MRPTRLSGFALLLVLLSAFAMANEEHDSACDAPGQPLLSVADFDGDGSVSGDDVSLLAKKIRETGYSALYDRNGDGELTRADLALAARDAGKASSPTDQRLAQMFRRFAYLEHVSGIEQIEALGYLPAGGVLAGHGQHWMTFNGLFATAGYRKADFNAAEGINVLGDQSAIPALFWGEGATPLFHDPSSPTGLSSLDWPTENGAWSAQRVQAFAGGPPDFFPDTDADAWHMHAGLCLTLRDDGRGPEWFFDQYMSNDECQALPNMQPFYFGGRYFNAWINIWMLHVWAFDLNPNGTFANTHPCVDPHARSEEETIGGREVPPFFQHHGGH